jgi:hypothetical protein
MAVASLGRGVEFSALKIGGAPTIREAGLTVEKNGGAGGAASTRPSSTVAVSKCDSLSGVQSGGCT